MNALQTVCISRLLTGDLIVQALSRDLDRPVLIGADGETSSPRRDCRD